MRRFYLYFLAVISTGVLALISCEKESPATGATATPPTNTAPRVNAGHDVWIALPANNGTLNGSASDLEYNIEKILWQKVSGPPSFVFEKPNSVVTKVSSLEKGSYAFELTVTDKGGLSAKDTVAVFVQEPAPPGHGEVVFNDLRWECPMGCSLVMDCFSCFVPVNQPFKVYLRSDNASPWVEVIPEANWTVNDKYIYSIYDNTLIIYTNDELNGTPDVKVTF